MERKAAYNTGLAKVAVQCSADTFVVKIATFAKPQNVMPHCLTTDNRLDNSASRHKKININKN
jgi:hypothetical protein